MKDTPTLLNLLLLLVYLAGSAVTSDGGKGSTNGPLELNIVGPDFVTVGVPCSFDCAAQCSPSCSYNMSIDGQIEQGNELFFTARQWEESLNLTCTARNNDSGRSSTVTKILQVLAGPTNVSITGPALMIPGAPQSFKCYADCRPSCNYTWGIKGRWLGGQGNEITVTPEELATSVTLNCKAINNGPLELNIVGADFVTVGVLYGFECAAQCSPSCSYNMSINGQIEQGNELFFTARQWEESLNLTCTARNDDSGSWTNQRIDHRPCPDDPRGPAQSFKWLFDGPSSVEISGVNTVTVEVPYGFQCSANCFQACTFTWTRGGLTTQGPELNLQLKEQVPPQVLICGPGAILIMGDSSVRVGDTYNFVCFVDCTPSCNFIWTFNGKIFNGDNIQLPVFHKGDKPMVASKLVVTVDEYRHNEALTCEAKNVASGVTAVSTKILTVIEPISVQPVSQDKPLAHQPFSLQFLCSSLMMGCTNA
ncbi:unnamed protein product [Coregonus sp. 'balchen']|nr:unnamed protein product [Coregonus sp. 'balchen']